MTNQEQQNLGFVRQYFGEVDDSRTFTAKEIWGIMNIFNPLVPKNFHDVGCEIQHTGKCSCGYISQEQFNWENTKKHFEANMLDGDPLEDCGGAVLSAESVFEYIKQTCVPRESYAELEAKLQKAREWAERQENCSIKKPLEDCFKDEAFRMGQIVGINQAKEELKKIITI
jgi:hypothetical protein